MSSRLSKAITREEVHAALEKHLESHIEAQMHYNAYEHRERPLMFVGRVFLYGVVGILCGALVEFIVTRVPNDGTSQVRCGGLLAMQLAVIAGLFLGASFVFGYTIDNWVMETWAGFLFALTFFTAQQSLTSNTMCTFNLK
jgi:hypothetical protein